MSSKFEFSSLPFRTQVETVAAGLAILAVVVVALVSYFDSGSGVSYPTVVRQAAEGVCAKQPTCSHWEVLGHRDVYQVRESYPNGTADTFIVITDGDRFIGIQADSN